MRCLLLVCSHCIIVANSVFQVACRNRCPYVASIYDIMRVLLIAIQVAVVRVLLWQIRYNMDRKGFLISDVSFREGFTNCIYSVGTVVGTESLS